MNAVETEFCHDDLESILTSKNLPNTILLPKVESKEHLKWVNFVMAHKLHYLSDKVFRENRGTCERPYV